MKRRPPRSTLFPTRRSSDLVTWTQAASAADAASTAAERQTFATAMRQSREPCERTSIDSMRMPVVRCLHTYVSEHLNRSEEHTSELQSQFHLVCRLLLEKKN